VSKEYAVVPADAYGEHYLEIEAFINSFSNDGWRLVGVNSKFYFFERDKPAFDVTKQNRFEEDK